MTNFVTVGNNIGVTLDAPYVAGSGTLALPAGYGAVVAARLIASGGSTPSAPHPLRFTLIQSSVIGPTGNITDPAGLTIFNATTLSTDTLTGVVAVEGTSDQAFDVGDSFAVLFTANAYVLLGQAINGAETILDDVFDEQRRLVLKTSQGTPTGTLDVGVLVYDTLNHRLCVHDGAGVWKVFAPL